jgi:hypothetical protein
MNTDGERGIYKEDRKGGNRENGKERKANHGWTRSANPIQNLHKIAKGL